MSDSDTRARQASTDAATGLGPPDRVFVRDYVRRMEVGFYPEERGVAQRLRFNVALDVEPGPGSHPGHALAEEASRPFVSYDQLTHAIDTLVEGPRVNLLETLAERLSAMCLGFPAARAAHVRIEKLDRLPDEATFGVEITRVRPGLAAAPERPFAGPR